MGLEMVNKDGATAEMQARIEELSRYPQSTIMDARIHYVDADYEATLQDVWRGDHREPRIVGTARPLMAADLLIFGARRRMSGEAIKHQDDMKQQNDGLSNIVTELTNGKS